MRIALLTYRGNMYCGGQGIYAAYLAREWQQLPNPHRGGGSRVLATPLGWFSLSSRAYGVDSRVPSGFESYLYRSEDGVHWRLVPLPQGGPSSPELEDDLMLDELCYAGGKLVLAGSFRSIVILLHLVAFGRSGVNASRDIEELATVHGYQCHAAAFYRCFRTIGASTAPIRSRLPGLSKIGGSDAFAAAHRSSAS